MFLLWGTQALGEWHSLFKTVGKSSWPENCMDVEASVNAIGMGTKLFDKQIKSIMDPFGLENNSSSLAETNFASISQAILSSEGSGLFKSSNRSYNETKNKVNALLQVRCLAVFLTSHKED